MDRRDIRLVKRLTFWLIFQKVSLFMIIVTAGPTHDFSLYGKVVKCHNIAAGQNGHFRQIISVL